MTAAQWYTKRLSDVSDRATVLDSIGGYVDIRTKLEFAVTEYDRKQSRKRGYNPYALGHYLNAIAATMEDAKLGGTIEAALSRNFNDRLLDVCLDAVRSA